MNLKTILISVSSFAAVLLAGSAHALVIDFAGMADGSYGEGGGQPIVLNNTHQASLGSLIISAYGYTINADNSLTGQEAYLDAGNAGMGVCQTVGSCAGNSDDNLTDDEVLWLHFSSSVTIENISFVNGGHGTSFDTAADFGLSIGAPNVANVNLGTSYGLTSSFNANGLGFTGTDFVFSNTNGNNSNPWVYYINTLTVSDTTTRTLPEPSLLLLVATGLVVVSVVSRRRLQI